MSVAHKVCHAHPAASPPLRHPSHGTYGDALATLVVDHGYGENLLNVHLTNPGYDDQGIAWFDFGNAFYTYYSFFQAAPWSKAGGVTVVSVDLPATAAADDSAAVTGAGGVTVSDPVTTPPAVIAGGAHQSDTAVILVTPSHNFAQRPCSCSLVPPCLFGAAQLASGVLGRFFFENREVASS